METIHYFSKQKKQKKTFECDYISDTRSPPYFHFITSNQNAKNQKRERKKMLRQ